MIFYRNIHFAERFSIWFIVYLKFNLFQFHFTSGCIQLSSTNSFINPLVSKRTYISIFFSSSSSWSCIVYSKWNETFSRWLGEFRDAKRRREGLTIRCKREPMSSIPCLPFSPMRYMESTSLSYKCVRGSLTGTRFWLVLTRLKPVKAVLVTDEVILSRRTREKRGNNPVPRLVHASRENSLANRYERIIVGYHAT